MALSYLRKVAPSCLSLHCISPNPSPCHQAAAVNNMDGEWELAQLELREGRLDAALAHFARAEARGNPHLTLYHITSPPLTSPHLTLPHLPSPHLPLTAP